MNQGMNACFLIPSNSWVTRDKKTSIPALIQGITVMVLWYIAGGGGQTNKLRRLYCTDYTDRATAFCLRS
jgi:hypothetical protein